MTNRNLSPLLNEIYSTLQPDERVENINKLMSKIGVLHPIPFFKEPAKAGVLYKSFLAYEDIKEDIGYPFLNVDPPSVLDDSEMEKLIPGFEEITTDLKNKLSDISYFNCFEIQRAHILKNNFYSISAGTPLLSVTYKGVATYLLFPCYRPLDDTKVVKDHSLQSSGSGIPSGLNNINLNDLLSLGQMLAFALPPPWGPFVAAGLMFFQFLFGQSNQKQLQALVRAILTGIREVIKDEDDITLINNIESFSQAFDVKLNVISADPTNTDYMLENVVPLLQHALDPSFEGSVYSSFEQILKKKYYLPKNGKDKLGFATYQLISASTMTISLIHKVLLQIFSLVASKYAAHKDEANFSKYTSLWLGTFENWHTLLKGGDSPKVVGLLDVLSGVRSNIINARNNAISLSITTQVQPETSLTYYLFSYSDNWLGDSKTISRCLSFDITCYKSSGNQLKALKRDRVAAFIDALDKLVSVNTIVEKTEFAFKLWMNHIKPIAPEENTITVDFSKSTTPTPKGKWVSGASVRYAVKFKNTVGEAVSAWTEYVKIKDKAFPVLNNIPIDKHQLTQARWIVRQFENQQEEDIGVIRDNVTTTWTDNKNGA